MMLIIHNAYKKQNNEKRRKNARRDMRAAYTHFSKYI